MEFLEAKLEKTQILALPPLTMEPSSREILPVANVANQRDGTRGALKSRFAKSVRPHGKTLVNATVYNVTLSNAYL